MSNKAVETRENADTGKTAAYVTGHRYHEIKKDTPVGKI